MEIILLDRAKEDRAFWIKAGNRKVLLRISK